MTATESGTRSSREHILEATVELLATGGAGAVTTRAVSEAAGVQPPTIYRLFGDKQGLLDAAAAYGFGEYLARKLRRAPETDALEELRRGWDQHVQLGLDNPVLYLLMYGQPRPDASSSAAEQAYSLLSALIRRIAEAGRLRVAQERATALVHATAHGITLSLIATVPDERDPALSTLAREAAIAAISTDAAPAAPAATAAAANRLRAEVPQLAGLTPGERALLGELLSRIGETAAAVPPQDGT